jgi:DNA-binding phage protein
MAKELRENPEFAVEYLRAALEEGDDPQILLIALRRIAESRGGVAKVAKEAGGVDELRAAFLNESRIRGCVRCSVAGNPGTLRSR